MSVWKRAYFCVVRKRAMSILLFAIILVVMLSVSTVAAVSDAVEAVRSGQVELHTGMAVEVFDEDELREWQEAIKEAEVKELVQKMEKLLRVLTIGIFLSGFAVLSFVLLFRVQSRLREFGILIASGISRGEIITQNMLEIGMISLTGFLATAVFVKPAAMHFVPIITGGAVQKEMMLVQTFTWQNYLFLYGAGAGIIIMASLVCGLQIMFASPRRLLSKLS